MTQHTLINLHPNEYVQELYYYQFEVNLDRCVRSCNALNGWSKKVSVSNRIEDLSMFKMIKGKNESKTLTKHASCECKCKFDDSKCISNQKWNIDKYWCKCKNTKNYCVCNKDYIWNPATCSCENNKYLACIIDDSVIACDEIIEETKSIPTNFNKKCNL